MQGFNRQAAWAYDSQEARAWQLAYGIWRWLVASLGKEVTPLTK